LPGVERSNPRAGRPYTILVADRNPNVRDFLARELRSQGYAAWIVGSVDEACKSIRGPEPPDMLVLDLDIPMLMEDDCLHRALNERPGLPLVIHSLHPHDATPGLLARAQALVEKSGSTDSLMAAISRLSQAAESVA
jgi:CheY-like chemotaxis protein